ncbi:unnamed protein product [Anisakis simplex]|uniref:BPTI/Kunitz inhibitor domain-containing protein n=1 Tax=Anisakis simplex TaxID=6269 RepID=A0A0M3JPB5_ANISI|nr:unnamed protein product [Anisakis simplex]
MVGEPLLGMDQRPQMCNENARCPGQYFCHIGYDEYTTLCCPSVGDPCNLPLAVGRGSHRIVRWYYNALTRQCEQFYYTGNSKFIRNIPSFFAYETRKGMICLIWTY